MNNDQIKLEKEASVITQRVEMLQNLKHWLIW